MIEIQPEEVFLALSHEDAFLQREDAGGFLGDGQFAFQPDRGGDAEQPDGFLTLSTGLGDGPGFIAVHPFETFLERFWRDEVGRGEGDDVGNAIVFGEYFPAFGEAGSEVGTEGHFSEAFRPGPFTAAPFLDRVIDLHGLILGGDDEGDEVETFQDFAIGFAADFGERSAVTKFGDDWN